MNSEAGGRTRMSDSPLTKTLFRDGIWEGVLTLDPDITTAPKMLVTHVEEPLTDVTVEAVPDEPGSWLVRITVPQRMISEGVQTVLITDPDTGARLGSFTLLAGDPLDEDIRAEMQLLRAELDMLKRAFRRHCTETAG